MVPSNVICRPLKPSEYRVEGAGGKHYIFEESPQQMVPEAPDDVEIGALPCLVSISDQGLNIIGAVNYLQYHADHALFFHAQLE